MRREFAKAHASLVHGLNRPRTVKVAERVPARLEICDSRPGFCHGLESLFLEPLGRAEGEARPCRWRDLAPPGLNCLGIEL